MLAEKIISFDDAVEYFMDETKLSKICHRSLLQEGSNSSKKLKTLLGIGEAMVTDGGLHVLFGEKTDY